MFSTPDAGTVLDDLGDKFASAFIASVAGARLDLAVFRETFPSWVSTASERFIANLIHERLWASLVARVDGLSEITVIDAEPIRELRVGVGYAIRVKRHHPGDKIASYPTRGALDFWSSAATLPGLEMVSLALGYMWNADERAIGGAVMSYRDGKDNPIWCIRFDEEPGTVGIAWTAVAPNLPQLDLSAFVDERSDDQ